MSKQVDSYFNEKIFQEFDTGNKLLIDFDTDEQSIKTDQKEGLFTKIVDLTDDVKKTRITKQWSDTPKYIEANEPIALNIRVPQEDSKIYGILLPKDEFLYDEIPEDLDNELNTQINGDTTGRIIIYGDEYLLLTGTKDNFPEKYRNLEPIRIKASEPEFVPNMVSYTVDMGKIIGLDKK